MSFPFLRLRSLGPGRRIWPFQRTRSNILAYSLLGATMYTFTIGKTTNLGPVYYHASSGSTSGESPIHNTGNSLQDASSRSLLPFIQKYNPEGHVVLSDKQIIRIPRRAVAIEQGSLMTEVLRAVFHGWAFTPQRKLLEFFHPEAAKSQDGFDTPLENDCPDTNPSSSTGLDIWDLRKMSNILSMPTGTQIVSHFTILDANTESVMMLFGDPGPGSDMAGLFQISVKGGGEKGSDELLEVSMTTAMFNPNANKKPFSGPMWRAHIV
jgi:hypothetical protein